MARTPAKMGRPTKYTPELGEEICRVIAVTPKSVGRICKENPHWPNADTIYEWRWKLKEFSEMFTKAKESQVEVLVDETIDISDDTTNDTVINKNGDEVCNSEYVNRSRLRVDTRKWLASKLAPRLYGDKTPSPDNNEDFISSHRNKLTDNGK